MNCERCGREIKWGMTKGDKYWTINVGPLEGKKVCNECYSQILPELNKLIDDQKTAARRGSRLRAIAVAISLAMGGLALATSGVGINDIMYFLVAIFFSWPVLILLFWLAPFLWVYSNSSENVENRGAWVLLAFFTGLIGALIYVAAARKKSQITIQPIASPTKDELVRSAVKALEQGEKNWLRSLWSRQNR